MVGWGRTPGPPVLRRLPSAAFRSLFSAIQLASSLRVSVNRPQTEAFPGQSCGPFSTPAPNLQGPLALRHKHPEDVHSQGRAKDSFELRTEVPSVDRRNMSLRVASKCEMSSHETQLADSCNI